MKNFIMIDNDILLDTCAFNTFKRIGTEGFTLYCYLLTQQGQKSYSQVTIKMISSFMNRAVKKPQMLIYTKEKMCRVGTMKDKKTILKNLYILNNNKLIDMETKNNYGINDIITIKTKVIDTENFTMISEGLFVDYIHKVGHVGWSLLFVLTKLHNVEFGSESSEGFANPTEEFLKSIVKKDVKTIRAYLHLLEEYKLIKIYVNKPMYKGLDSHGSKFYEFIPNNYVVKNRLVENKYYLDK